MIPKRYPENTKRFGPIVVIYDPVAVAIHIEGNSEANLIPCRAFVDAYQLGHERELALIYSRFRIHGIEADIVEQIRVWVESQFFVRTVSYNSEIPHAYHFQNGVTVVVTSSKRFQIYYKGGNEYILWSRQRSIARLYTEGDFIGVRHANVNDIRLTINGRDFHFHNKELLMSRTIEINIDDNKVQITDPKITRINC